MAAIWSEWIPGVLANTQLTQLAKERYIVGAPKNARPDASAIDLHVADKCYELRGGSIKPFGAGFLRQVTESGAKSIDLHKDGSWHLRVGATYVFKLKETLRRFRKGPIWGQATAKSSVGRVDVLARLVVDGMFHYERFDPEDVVDTAAMFLEVTPITFCVRVRPGDSLNQLRFFYGHPDACELKGEEICRTCLDKDKPNLTVDLMAVDINGVQGCGFRASPLDVNQFIPLWRDENGKAITDPVPWWEIVPSTSEERLQIHVDKFYILRSKERLRVHQDVAVYARAIDEEIGEMRIHYAGFAHPGFGWERPDHKKGTPLIFEVRGHSVPVTLRDSEMLARLQFFRMSDTPELDDPGDDSYNRQELKLSKYFKEWSSRPRLAQSDDAN